MTKKVISCLKLYALGIACVVMAALIPLTGNGAAVIAVRLVVLGATFSLSVHEARRTRRGRRGQRDDG